MRVRSKLENGSHVAVVGGGPAGSLFALHLLNLARQTGLSLRVTIFEPRSFASQGVGGCNMCAGILSSSLVHNLRRLDLELPAEVVLSRINSYQLHTPHGSMQVPQPHPLERIYCVYRGGGPQGARHEGRISLDEFLLRSAERRGARVEPALVEKLIPSTQRPALLCGAERREYDLLVLACGVNARLREALGAPYAPPPTKRMIQVELAVGEEEIRRRLGSRVHVFLMPGDRLDFGILVPKGEHVTASLLGRGRHPMTMAEFLRHPQLRRLLPKGAKPCCGCQPRIAVGSARHPYGHRMVVVGDAAVARLYKDGIGSAFRTAGRAARTAVLHGISEKDFRRHYRPLCRELTRDNRFGQLLFSLHRRGKESARFFRLQQRVMGQERTAPYPARRLHPINWGMFTGTHSYRSIFARMLSPRLWRSFLTAALPAASGRRSVPAVASEDGEPTRILVLGGGFAGLHAARRLERILGRDPAVRITLVSDQNFFLFTPMLHQVAGGGLEPRHIATPIRRLRGQRRFRFLQARVQGVDLARRRVSADRGELRYDVLVLALGSVTDRRLLQRGSRAVMGLKTLQDAVALRNHIIRMFETAVAMERDPTALLCFVVVGAGITGVQAAAELNDLVRRCLPREYVRIQAQSIRILLIQDDSSLLPEMHGALASRARRNLEEMGVEVLTGTTVTDVGEGYVELEGCRRIRSHTVIWTPGIVANPVVSALPVEQDELGRVRVNEYLELPGHPGVYALGDNACQPHHRTGLPLQSTAHIAIRQPRAVAANIAAYLGRGKRRPYRYAHMGQLVALGSRSALAEIFGFKLFGLFARLLWLAAYATLMEGRLNQLRVVSDWLLASLFGRDSTWLRRDPLDFHLRQKEKEDGRPADARRRARPDTALPRQPGPDRRTAAGR